MAIMLSNLVATSRAVAATRSRLAKRDLLADLLRAVDIDERAIAISYLSGRPLQDRLGVGWASLRKADVPPRSSAGLSLTAVDRLLEDIASASGPGSTGRKAALLADLLGAATEDEQGFLRRLIMRDLKQGATEGAMIEALAAAAAVPAGDLRRAAMLSGSVVEAGVIALAAGSPGLAEIHPRLFTPISPMLASTAESLDTAMEGFGIASVEAKLDGARIQVHRCGDAVAVYTRNLNDVTSRMPEVVEIVRHFDLDDVILDGEVLSVAENGRPVPFQDTMGRFGRESNPAPARSQALTPFFFDVLMADGRDVLDLPTKDRLELLDVLPAENRMRRIMTSDGVTAHAFFREVLEAGHEGVMVKDLDAPYAAGRRGSAWLKVKPTYTLDLVVLGVEWGSGRRRGRLSNIHVGARDPAGGFVMLGKTFKGMTDEMLEWQTRRFLELETRREGHVVWVRPEQVVEIAIDGVQRSSRYPGGMALRFARVKRYRDDKTPAEADTIGFVRQIFEGAAPSYEAQRISELRASQELRPARAARPEGKSAKNLFRCREHG